MNILIADDHSLVRELFATVLEARFPDGRVDQAANREETQSRLESGIAYDVLLLDLHMPGMRGVECAVDIARAYPQSRTIVLTGVEEASVALHALRCGLKGFVPKSLGVDAAVSAVRLVLAGETYVPSLILDGMVHGTKHVGAMPMENRTLPASANDFAEEADGSGSDDSSLDDLTDRETAVLVAISEGKSNKEIARDFDIAEITVKVHAQGVFRKLGVRNRTQAAAAYLSAR